MQRGPQSVAVMADVSNRLHANGSVQLVQITLSNVLFTVSGLKQNISFGKVPYSNDRFKHIAQSSKKQVLFTAFILDPYGLRL